MPVVSRSNNRILPPNSRAADVAERAINEITPIQQTRMYNAFRVQGYPGVLYNRLEQGRNCSCGSSRHNLATRLDQSGKLAPEFITELMTGAPAGTDNAGPTRGMTDTNRNTEGYVVDLLGAPDVFKDDGAERPEDLDDIIGNFDISGFGISDISCPVCFGSGFIGGYAPFHAFRKVFPVNDPDLELDGNAEIDANHRPWRALASSFTVTLVLPLGAIGIDSMRVMYMQDQVPCQITINQRPLSYFEVMKNRGKRVQLGVVFNKPTRFTHMELQLPTSTESAYFEFPKLPQSGDLMKLDSTNPFTIYLSPNIPHVDSQDVIVESRFGRALIIGATSPWNTRQRHHLGNEVEVRVAQPQEMYTILPKRGRVPTKNQTTVGTHDNSRGRYRT